MKQIIYLITTLALLIGVASCQRECPNASPTSISVVPQSLTMHVGESQTLQVTYEPKDVSFPISYESQSVDVVTVTEQGVVHAVKEGKTNIIVKVADKEVSCPVTVVAKEVPVETTLTVTTPELTIMKGQKAQIEYVVTPKETPVTFESDTPEVASVSETGEVTGLLMGHATITLTANGKSATCTVIVEDDPENIKQEMPLLKFSAKYNKELHVTEVLYGLRAPKVADIIAAYSKESLAECVRTKAMLNKLGFKDFKEIPISVDGRDESGLQAAKEGDPDIYVRLYNDPKPELKSILYIEFGKKLPPDPIKTKHSIIPDAKDFPSLTDFATLNADKIKTFESNLGLRTYDDKKSASGTTLYFNTKEDQISKSNIEYVSYLLEPLLFPPVFINCRLLCVGSQEDLESEEMKSYLKTNGFDQKYEITQDGDKELHVYNAQGDLCVVSLRTYEDPAICVMTITLKKDLQSNLKAKQVIRSYPKAIRCIR